MGASLTMIDGHYGYLARDGREHAIKLLDALNAAEFEPWTLVDAAWTSKPGSAVNTGNRDGGFLCRHDGQPAGASVWAIATRRQLGAIGRRIVTRSKSFLGKPAFWGR
jgi:hypothetical protein